MITRAVLALLVAAAIATTAQAAQFVSLKTGIGYDRERFRLIQETQTVTVLDWPVYVLAHYRNTRSGERWEMRITPPDGAFTWTWTHTARDSASNYYLSFLIPLAGTPNEERPGTWTVTMTNEGQQNSSQLQVTPASRQVLDELRSARLDSFVPAYRLGAAASMFGEHELAVSALQQAASLARRSPYPHLALCRHYLRVQQKDQARQSCATVRGLLMGYEDRTIAGWLLSEVDKLMARLE